MEQKQRIHCPIDIKKAGNLKKLIFMMQMVDATDKNRKPDAEELRDCSSSDKDFTGGAALKAFNDPELGQGYRNYFEAID